MASSDARTRTDESRAAWRSVAAAIVLAVTMLGTTLPTPLYGLYERRFGFGSFMTTVIYATYAVGVIIALLLFGHWSDRVGRRPLLAVAVLLSGLSAVAFLMTGGLTLLFAGRMLSGLSAGLITGTATAAIIELTPSRHRCHAPLVATAANMGGLGCGPLLAGVLAAYAPDPLRTPYTVDLVLVAGAGTLLFLLPETVHPAGPARLRPQSLRIPADVRATFVSAATAGFAGFATLGLFTSIAPSFVAGVLGIKNTALSGLIVFVVFAASTTGQLTTGRIPPERALFLSSAILVAGMILISVSLLVTSLGTLIAGAVAAGAGQGVGFRAAIAAVNEQSPPQRRGEITSTLFFVLYIGISIPVVGVGVCAQLLGLRTAGIAFAAFVTLLAVVAAARVLRRTPVRPTARG